MRVVIKGGQGSGSWSGPDQPRFAWNSRKGQQQHKETIAQKVLEYGADQIDFKRKKSLKGSRIILGEVDGSPTVYKKPRKEEGAFGFRNEAVAFELSKLTGWNTVPAVTKAKGDDAFYQKYVSDLNGATSAQIFDGNAYADNRYPLTVNGEFDENSVYQVALLDYFIQNTDRHEGNLFYEDRDGVKFLRAIDNSIGFNLGHVIGGKDNHPVNDAESYEFKSTRAFTDALSEAVIPSDVMDSIADLADAVESNEVIGTLLSPEEKDGLLQRIQYVRDGGQMPDTKVRKKPFSYR